MAVEGLWTELTVPEGSGADYGVRVEGAELEPYVKKGGTALIKRDAQIRDGDVGLFEADGGMWQQAAKASITAYFEDKLAEEVKDGKIVVMM